MNIKDKFVWLGLAVISFIILILALLIALSKGWISNTLFFVIISLLITVIILGVVGYYLSNLSTSPINTKLVDPVDASRAIEKFYLLHKGIAQINIIQKRIVDPIVKVGKDTFMRVYVTTMENPHPVALKVPLSRGIKAIENGWMNFDEEYDLKFDKKEDKQFSHDVSTDMLEELEDLPADIRNSLLGVKEEKSPDRIVIENQLQKISKNLENGVTNNET